MTGIATQVVMRRGVMALEYYWLLALRLWHKQAAFSDIYRIQAKTTGQVFLSPSMKVFKGELR